ncbi:TetR family transcriptional regulator [Leptospira sp. 96542]|nr:TetR family transcriptional regulator [Leptospira sp. 96542]
MKSNDQKTHSSKEKDTNKSQKTKEQIYNTAISLFQKVGYEKATMRKISTDACVSLGSAYYYFKSKEDIVLEFYSISQNDAKTQAYEFNNSTKDFQKRFKNIILFKLESFAKYKNFLSILARNAGDPNHPISPFSQNTKVIREEAVQIIRDSLINSNLKLRGEFLEILPELLWMYQMGIVYFWLSDGSASYLRTKAMIDESMNLVFKLIHLAKFPLVKPVLNSILRIHRLVTAV